MTTIAVTTTRPDHVIVRTVRNDSTTVTTIRRDTVIRSTGLATGPRGPQGDQGPQGEQGDPGAGTDHETWIQAVASATWTITHSLNRKPSVVVIDSGGTTQIGGISYPDDVTVVLAFSAAFSGTAHLT